MMTSYVEKILQPDEQVIYRAIVHWSVYLSGAVFLVLGALWSLWLATFGAFLLIAAFIRRRSTELVITNLRIIAKTGFIMRKSSEINRAKVEGVEVRQSVLGRVLGYGTVIVRGTGGGLAPVKHIADPLTFRIRITSD